MASKDKKEVTKQLKVGFIKPVHQAECARTKEGWKSKDVCGFQGFKQSLP